MSRLASKLRNAHRRANRVRATVSGSAERPRLAVHVSNMHITAQVIDDTTGKTLIYSTTVGQKMSGNMTEKAAWVGADVATKAKKAKVTKVAFDRHDRKYHGRLKALAQAAREGGLEF